MISTFFAGRRLGKPPTARLHRRSFHGTLASLAMAFAGWAQKEHGYLTAYNRLARETLTSCCIVLYFRWRLLLDRPAAFHAWARSALPWTLRTNDDADPAQVQKFRDAVVEIEGAAVARAARRA
jgi:hypothetical protein